VSSREGEKGEGGRKGCVVLFSLRLCHKEGREGGRGGLGFLSLGGKGGGGEKGEGDLLLSSTFSAVFGKKKGEKRQN